MIAFTAAEIAEITSGRLDADPGITPLSVVTDSREAIQGSLYVAKPGEHADGHDFIDAAFAAGAVLALVERPVAGPDGTARPSIVVPTPSWRWGPSPPKQSAASAPPVLKPAAS